MNNLYFVCSWNYSYGKRARECPDKTRKREEEVGALFMKIISDKRETWSVSTGPKYSSECTHGYHKQIGSALQGRRDNETLLGGGREQGLHLPLLFWGLVPAMQILHPKTQRFL